MRRQGALYQKLVLACLALSLIGGISAASAASAHADEVFTSRKTVGPYAEGNHSSSGLVDLIQGEGFQYEACVDMRVEANGNYTNSSCNSAGHVAEQEPRNEGYARVWNAVNHNNEIWGWARF
jgi:hypothetical protein